MHDRVVRIPFELDARIPELSMGERIALIAVCALAAAMPRTVLGDLKRELPAWPPRWTPPWQPVSSGR
ncbi:hypothetical protein ACWCXH_35960 [Kitasatospora sp. NPDC001660]